MEHLIDLALAILARLLGAELEVWIPVLSERLIEYAVRRLSDPDRHRYREEWNAHLDECPSMGAKFVHAVGCFIGAGRIELSLTKRRYIEGEEARGFSKAWNALDKRLGEWADKLHEHNEVKLGELEIEIERLKREGKRLRSTLDKVGDSSAIN